MRWRGARRNAQPDPEKRAAGRDPCARFPRACTGVAISCRSLKASRVWSIATCIAPMMACVRKSRTPVRLAAWSSGGETGLPFGGRHDACADRHRLDEFPHASDADVGGELSNLWLDWRGPARFWRGAFTDYEPGIHWPQVQMQSGTTGINTVRIYNPVKQGYDQDPQCVFIRPLVARACRRTGSLHP